MKYSKVANRFFLLFLPFLFTGCYTQFQTFDKYSVEDEYAAHNAGNNFNNSQHDYNESGATYHNDEVNKEYPIEELAPEENHANRPFQQGVDDGYFTGWNGYYPYKGPEDLNRYRLMHGYRSDIYRYRCTYHLFNFYSYYYSRDYYLTHWNRYERYSSRDSCFFSDWGYYAPFHRGYWGNSYFSYSDAYANHYYSKGNKYEHSNEINRKSTRNSVTYTTGVITRSENSGDTRSRGMLTHPLSTNSGVQVRTSGSDTRSRTSSGSVGSSSTRSRGTGSSVGRSRSSSGSKSRGSGSLIGGSRSSSGSKSSGSSERSRSGDNLRSNDRGEITAASVNTIKISTMKTVKSTIPYRRVTTRVSSSDRSSRSYSYNRKGYDELFNTSAFDGSGTAGFNIRRSSNKSSTGRRNTVRNSSSGGSKTKEIRSTRSRPSSGSDGSGSNSSSKKRSRNN